MANLMDQFKMSILEFFKDATKLKDIDKTEFKGFLKTLIENHKIISTTLNSIDKKTATSFDERLLSLLPSSNTKSAAAWMKFKKSLQQKAAGMEKQKIFSSLVKANDIHKAILTEISSNLDKIFGESDVIEIINLRKSQFAIFGIVVASMKLTRWSEYMFTYLTGLVDGTDGEIPKYRELALSNDVDTVIDLVNKSVSSDNFSVLKDIARMQAAMDDQPLTVDGMVNKRSFDPIKVAQVVTVTLTIVQYIAIAISGFIILRAIFRWLPEHMELMAHEAYLRNKELKEWLDAHVAKLRMDLDDLNPNDPAYQKLVRIIDVYDEKIRDLDSKIDDYLNN